MNTIEADFSALVAEVAEGLVAREALLVTAESCTGGWIAKVCTDRAGSSAWFDRGVVTYSNAAKHELLGVPEALIAQHGAVSRPVVEAMAAGALAHSAARYSVAVSGIAGPSGGTPDKPVGTVWLAWGTPAGVSAVCAHFSGDREQVRAATVAAALRGLLERL
jgi:nicotinamide-nucleotide amidase